MIALLERKIPGFHRVATNLLVLLVGLSVALSGWAALHNHNSQVTVCQQVESLKTVIRRQVETSASLLGKRGTAGYAYYSQHPAELANAREQIRAELSNFGPKECK